MCLLKSVGHLLTSTLDIPVLSHNMNWAVTSSLLWIITVTSAQQEVHLNTRLGDITGVSEDVNGTEVHKYLGVPYAKPPTGGLRFAKPEMHGPFAGGKLKGTALGEICFQLGLSGYVGSEDCLFLNIYTSVSTSKKSVLIWIHGGGFGQGSGGLYDPTNIVAAEDVIVVTINYRLGPLGFLSTGDSRLPGNYGLWDQRLAIQWVKDNVEDYGGDPNSITLFGESAGGISASFHMLSPVNNNSLFQRVITESGSALGLVAFVSDPFKMFEPIFTALNCSLDNNLESCLRKKNIQDLLNSAIPGPSIFFTPVIDHDYLHFGIPQIIDSFTRNGASFETTKMVGNYGTYDLLSGWNDQEGLFMIGTLPAMAPYVNSTILHQGLSSELLADLLGVFPFAESGSINGGRYNNLMIDIFIEFYMNSPDKLNSDGRSMKDKRLEIYTQIASDVLLVLPTIQHLQLHSAMSNRNTFAYEFTNKRNSPGLFDEGPDWLRTGAVHGDELPFVFGFRQTAFDAGYNASDVERELSRRMIKQWADFAKTGNPSTVDYRKFEYPRDQSYTQLKTGQPEILTFPYNSKERLLSSVISALVQGQEIVQPTTSTATTTAGTTEEICANMTNDYLNGMLSLTPQEADKAITATLVVAVLLAALCIIFIISVVHLKVKMARNKSR